MNTTEIEKPKFLPSLQGLRFIAAAMVCLHHTVPVWGTTPRLAKIYLTGAYGVSLFFILSGFVLMWNCEPEVKPARFIRRRAIRIYPLNALCLFLSLAAFYSMGSPLAGYVDSGTVWEKLSALFLVQSWLPLQWTEKYVHLSQTWNGVSWSLSCEMFFYLAAPWLFIWMRKQKIASLVGLAAIGYTAILFLNFLALRRGNELLLYFSLISPYFRFFEFFIGALAAVIVRKFQFSAEIIKPLGIAALCSLATVAFAFVLFHEAFPRSNYIFTYFFIFPFCALISALALTDLNGLTFKIFLKPSVLTLGDASFAFYMIHALCLGWVAMKTAPPGFTLLEITRWIFTALVALLSVVVHKFYEDPIRRRLNKRFALGGH